MLGVFLDRDTVDRGDLDLGPLAAALPDWRLHDFSRPAQVAERLAEASVAVTNKVLLDAMTLAAAPALRLICVTATGTNNVDLEAARQCGITVCNVRGYATPAVVQHVFALILALTTRLFDYQRDVTAGRWQDSPYFCLLDHPIRELAGRSLGIVGYGELGRAVAHVAGAFGMRVLIAQSRVGPPCAERLPLDELLTTVDVVSLHTPLTPQTRGMIGAPQLALMKADALLINTARGGLIDEWALADALRAGRLGGAGIDVLAEEPPHSDSPLLAADIPNLIVTPHIAWASREARQRVVNEIAANVQAFLAGTPRNVVVV
ncbi:MAG: 2-hydroxyacid dehydrogenase [Gammaproteobacteria bacterium]